MRMLFAALGLAAIVVQTASAAPRPETLYTSPTGPIVAFAQNGSLLAWFVKGAKRCNRVWVLSTATGAEVPLPEQTSSTFNVTCDWDLVPPIRLAVDGKTARALWTLRERTPLRFDYLIGASFRDRLERRFQQIAHASRGAGLWLGGIAGDAGELVYSVTSVDFVDEVGCLSNPKKPRACALRIGDGGGVYRVVGRSTQLIPGTEPGGTQVALADGHVAYIRAATVQDNGTPLSSAQIDIRAVNDGKLVTQLSPEGTPVALALSRTVLATLERRQKGLVLVWYHASGGKQAGSIPVAASTSADISANGRAIVFRSGRSIRVVDVRTHTVRTVARAAATPVGLSIAGNRIAWAENIGGKGRIRAFLLR
jgi:prepilin-type processing-associated H-X9-DG protein